MSEAWAKLLSEGGILAALVVILFIIKALVPLFSRKHNGNGTSAGLTAAEWQAVILKLVKQALLETTPERHDRLEQLLDKSLSHWSAQRNEELRKNVTDLILKDLKDTRHDLRDMVAATLAKMELKRLHGE